MARAIADDCIPPKFLSSYKGHVEIEEAKNALQVSNKKMISISSQWISFK
jgi:hypothetical protein